MTMSTHGDALRRLIAEAIGTHEVVAASLGLNATDLRCLELAGSEADMTPTRLAELSDLTSGAVTGVIDRLEGAGFVRRESDPGDRRRLLVSGIDRYFEFSLIFRLQQANDPVVLELFAHRPDKDGTQQALRNRVTIA